MATISNNSKNTGSISNATIGATWADANYTWAEATSTWQNIYTFGNTTLNTATITNVTKN